jgi:hypothetical protein
MSMLQMFSQNLEQLTASLINILKKVWIRKKTKTLKTFLNQVKEWVKVEVSSSFLMIKGF